MALILSNLGWCQLQMCPSRCVEHLATWSIIGLVSPAWSQFRVSKQGFLRGRYVRPGRDVGLDPLGEPTNVRCRGPMFV